MAVAAALALVVGGGGALGAYLVHRDRVGALKWLAARLQARIQGQHTTHLVADVTLRPDAERLEAMAQLTMASDEPGRRHYYFLLSPGLELQDVRANGEPCAVRRLWLIARVTVPEAPEVGAPFDLTFRYAGNPAGGFGGMAAGYLDADGVLLGVDDFWYPSDIQGFFSADLTVRAPPPFRLVTSGDVVEQHDVDGMRVVRQRWPRPLGGLALVAEDFDVATREANGRRYDAYIPRGARYDPDRLLDAAVESDAAYTELFGPSGFRRTALAIAPRLYRAFNDGSGLLVLAPRYVRQGDYGYRVIAHEVAHNWWGATVAERWLDPGSGGEWLVEGFAEMSAMWALERRFGDAALARAMEDRLFPPDAQRPVAAMSVIDNTLAEEPARWTIYRKGAAVATLLRHTLGDATFAEVCRAFLERARFTQATDAQFARVASEISGENLDVFFARWVRGDALVDFALSPGPEEPTAAVLRNTGDAPVLRPVQVGLVLPGERALFEVAPADVGEVQRNVLALPGARLIADPNLRWPDVVRSNNVWPNAPPLRWVVPAPGGARVARVLGLPLRWEPHQVELRTEGAPPLTYQFPRAVEAAPVWLPDGSGVLVSVAPPGAEREPALYYCAATPEGAAPPEPRRLGHGADVAPLPGEPDAFLYAVDGAIARGTRDGGGAPQLAVDGWRLETPRPAPDGTRGVCTGHKLGESVLWLWDLRAPGDARRVLTTDRDRLEAWWLPDSGHLVVLHGRDDRRVLSVLDTQTGTLHTVVDDFALIDDVAVTADGAVFFTGRRTLDYPLNRRELWRIDSRTGTPVRLAADPTGSYDALQVLTGSDEIQCVLARPVPEFPARSWAERTPVRVAIPPS